MLKIIYGILIVLILILHGFLSHFLYGDQNINQNIDSVEASKTTIQNVLVKRVGLTNQQ